jgi:RHS repeat-associated protein
VRIAKQVDGKTAQAFVYDFAGRIRGELDANGVLASRLLYGSRPHVPDFVAKENAKYHLVTDARGSVRLAIDVATGQVVQRIDYDAWGNILRNTNPSLHPFAYAGGLYDADTRLTRFGARDYDAETGRWTAKDPIGFLGGQANIYAYVGNDPVNHADPSGLGVDAWIRIARTVWKNHIVPRHVRPLAQYGSKGRFNTTSPAKIEKMANKAICNADRATLQADGRTLYERDMGRQVGTRGESFVRVVVDQAREIVTTFPADGFKSIVPLLDLTGDGVFDVLDVVNFYSGFVSVEYDDGVI